MDQYKHYSKESQNCFFLPVFIFFTFLLVSFRFIFQLLTGDLPCPVEGETTPAVWIQGQLQPVQKEH